MKLLQNIIFFGFSILSKNTKNLFKFFLFDQYNKLVFSIFFYICINKIKDNFQKYNIKLNIDFVYNLDNHKIVFSL